MCLKNSKEKKNKDSDKYCENKNLFVKNFFYSDPYDKSDEDTFLIYTPLTRETMI